MNTCLNKKREKILYTRNISKSYGDRKIIEDISIELYKNEIVGLLGVSGIGKSTLFNVLSGLLLPEKGSVYLHDEEITGKPGHVSYMHQKDLLLPYKNIVDNVSLPLRLKGYKKKEARGRAMEYMDLFGLSGYEEKYPAQLSGGMRQRAALLRTYLFSRDVYLLDEPFSALDAMTRSRMHKWYLDIASRLGMSTIFITHDIDEAIMLSDRIYIMSGSPGKIAMEIHIDAGRERDEDFATSDAFINYKRTILDFFNQGQIL